MQERRWVGTTYGNAWMHKHLIGMLKWIDVRVLYLFSAIFIVPICLLRNPSRHIIYCYFRDRIGWSRIKSAWYTYINHCQFSQVVIDKFAMYAGKRFKVNVIGYEHYKNLELQEPGFVQLSSHVGNYEVAGFSLTAEHKRFNAIVYGGEKSTVMEERNKLLLKDNIHIIPIKDDMSHLFEISSALSNNECISMPADRLFGSDKSVNVSFLGCGTRLPLGPFQIATMNNLDVLAVNVVKSSLLEYKVFVKPLIYDKTASRQDRINQLVTSYCEELETVVRNYPTQWYNFFDFWKQ